MEEVSPPEDMRPEDIRHEDMRLEDMRPEDKRFDFWDAILGVIVEPRRTLKRFGEEGVPLRWGFFALLVTSIISSLSGLPSLGSALRELGLGEVTGGIFGVLGVVGVIISIISWFLTAAVVHMTAVLLGAKEREYDREYDKREVGAPRVRDYSRARNLLAMTAFTHVPQVFNAPASLLSRLIGMWVGVVAGLAVTVWVIVLTVIAVAENYGFSSGRAVLTVFLPGIVIFAVVFALILVFALSLAPAVMTPGAMPVPGL